MTDEVREFDLSDILTVTTGLLVSTRHMDGIYDILNFMTGDNLFTHQLPRAGNECKPEILKQHPRLADIQNPDWDDDVTPLEVNSWVAAMKLEYGSTLPIKPLSPEDHTVINPLDELGMMGVGPDKIIPVVIDDDD